MALYDNKYWLLTHIRNSFISTDDTGMCELVMVGEDLPKDLVETLDSYPDTDDSQEEDDIEPESYDIQLDMDYGVRHRSNTAAWLERMDQARKRAAKVKNVKWETNSDKLTQVEMDEMFLKKDVSKRKPQSIEKSLLSQQLEKCTKLPQNPFVHYTKFDGSAQVGIPVRKYKIFLTMLPEEHRNYPMIVCCIATAKIQELIGLICLKCSTAHGDYVLQSVTNYGLYITEEDGEVEGGFPCLDPKECIAKFGFLCLSLVEQKNASKNVSFDTIECETSGEMPKTRIISTPTIDETTQQKLMEGHNTAMQAPDYKSYTVYIINKMRAKVEIHLGISLDKIEIDPIHQKSSKFALVRQKAVSHHIHSIASCAIVDSRSNKCTFRVVYSLSFGNFTGTTSEASSGCISPLQSSASFKHYDFESDVPTAKEIVQKINHILDLRSSNSQKEYLAILERKLLRRNRSFNFQNK